MAVVCLNRPNVCVHTTESLEAPDDDDDDDVTGNQDRQHHQFALSTICDETESVYKCTVTRSCNGNTTRISRVYECCHGYSRTQPDEHGCTTREQLEDLLSTLHSLNATEMVRATETAGLQSSLATDNVTVFAPINAAFDALHQPTAMKNDNNVVIITPELTSMANGLRRTLSAHLVPGFSRSSGWDDDMLLHTTNDQADIRVNVFHLRDKVVTANCRRILSADHSASNGVVHLVSDLLQPVTQSVADIISSHPQLTQFAQLVERSGLWDELSAMLGGGVRDLSVFAPSNEAFDKLTSSLRQQLLGRHDNQHCISKLLLQHVVCHVVCSTAIDTTAYTINALGNRVNLTRGPATTVTTTTDHDDDDDDDDNNLRFNTAVVTAADLMATDGVVHIVDELSIPTDALPLTAVADQLGASFWLRLVHKAKMVDALNDLNNVTAFIPTNDAFQELPANVTELWEDESSELRRMLESHIVPHRRLRADSFYNNLRLPSINSLPINFNVLHSFPFGDEQIASVQCAPVVSTDIDTCSGVIHLIDEVMLPPVGDILDLLYRQPQFSRLVSLLKDINYAEAFQSQDEIVTFFAPTNEAFSSLPNGVADQLTENPETAQLIIQHHIIRGAVCCSTMSGSRWFTPHHEQTVDGHWVSVRRRHGQSLVDGVPIRSCDGMAVNGIVHSVDSFLPSALRHHLILRRHRAARRHRAHDIWSILDALQI